MFIEQPNSILKQIFFKTISENRDTSVNEPF